MKITKIAYNFFDDNPGLLRTWCTRFLFRALFHFTWLKGGDGGEVTPFSTFSNDVPCLDAPFPPLVLAQVFDTLNETLRAG